MNAKIPVYAIQKSASIVVHLQTNSMLHTNTRHVYTNQCVCMYALPSHRLSALQYSTRTFYGLPPTQNAKFVLSKHHGRSGEEQVWLGWEVWPTGVRSRSRYSLCHHHIKYYRRLQEWTLKASSCSECMLLSERRSGSFRSSLVKMADSLGWFLVMRLRRARIRVS